MKNITEYVMKLWHVMKHSFATNPDLEICPPLRRSQNCWLGRQTQRGNGSAINSFYRAYSAPCLIEDYKTPNLSGDPITIPGWVLPPAMNQWIICGADRVHCPRLNAGRRWTRTPRSGFPTLPSEFSSDKPEPSSEVCCS